MPPAEELEPAKHGLVANPGEQKRAASAEHEPVGPLAPEHLGLAIALEGAEDDDRPCPPLGEDRREGRQRRDVRHLIERQEQRQRELTARRAVGDPKRRGADLLDEPDDERGQVHLGISARSSRSSAAPTTPTTSPTPT